LGEGFFIKSFGCGKTAKDLEAPGALGEHSPEIFDPSSFAGCDRSVFTNTAKGNAGSGTPNPFPAMPGEGEWPGGRRDSFSGGAKDRFYLIEYGPFGKKINPR
jgi:hypothetical protein